MSKWDFLLEERLPHHWCPGCGNGIILKALASVLGKLGFEKDKVVVVTGIGCWGKAGAYLSTHSLHGIHGRAIPIATGIKAGNPSLKVIVLMGDGDGANIGGNHLIHAARKNVEITAIVANNFNFGLTGGQYSATSFRDDKSITSPYGNIEDSFDLCSLVETAGAGYVARSTVYHYHQLKKLMQEALVEESFSFLEVFSSCPTYFGRFNNIESPAQILRFFKEITMSHRDYNNLSIEEKERRFVIGRLAYREVEGFFARYRKVQEKARKGEVEY